MSLRQHTSGDFRIVDIGRAKFSLLVIPLAPVVVAVLSYSCSDPYYTVSDSVNYTSPINNDSGYYPQSGVPTSSLEVAFIESDIEYLMERYPGTSERDIEVAALATRKTLNDKFGTDFTYRNILTALTMVDEEAVGHDIVVAGGFVVTAYELKLNSDPSPSSLETAPLLDDSEIEIYEPPAPMTETERENRRERKRKERDELIERAKKQAEADRIRRALENQ